MKKDGKRYPWIKSIFRKGGKNPAEGVYAGPDMMDRAGAEKPVYAGPGYKKDGPDESRKIYEGPDFFSGNGNREEADRPVEDVYAGPEFFERPGPDENEPEDIPFDEPDEDGPALLTYAGPEYSPPPTPELVMCVYAGPEYFNPSEGGVPAGSAPQPQPEDKPDVPENGGDGTRCPACGTLLIEGSEFCHECGTPVKKDE